MRLFVNATQSKLKMWPTASGNAKLRVLLLKWFPLITVLIYLTCLEFHQSHSVERLVFKVNNKNTRKMYETCSKQQWRHQNDVTDVVLVSLLLTLNIFHISSTGITVMNWLCSVRVKVSVKNHNNFFSNKECFTKATSDIQRNNLNIFVYINVSYNFHIYNIKKRHFRTHLAHT